MASYFLLLVMAVCWKGIDTKTKNSVSIVFGGDVDFSRIVKYTHHVYNCSYDDSLKRLKKYFQSGDFAMVNLETTLGEPEKEMNPKTLTALWSEVSVLRAIKNVGIDYVTVANNHIQDYREPATNKTIDSLRKYGITYSGIIYGKDPYAKQKPLILEKNGLKIGILSYCDLDRCHNNWENRESGPPLLKVPNVLTEVKSLRKKDKCDVVILFLHWGREYASVIPVGVVGIIKNLTENAHIDLIVGSHPHVVSKHWYVKNTLIASSIGNLLFTPNALANFIFNDFIYDDKKKKTDNLAYYERIWYKQMQVMEDETQIGRLLRVEFDKNGVIKKKSKYITTRIFATKQHCMATKADSTKWQPICGEGDPNCTGTPTCNYIHCDDEEPLPKKMPSSPTKEGRMGSKL